MNNAIKKFLVTDKISVKDAMRQMGKVGEKILFVVDQKNLFLGSLTDGDIRRWVLSEGALSASIDKIYNRNPRFVQENYDIKDVKAIMLEEKIAWIPVVNKDRQIQEVLLWGDILGHELGVIQRKIDIPVVIMAGGRGARLDPFTSVLPKPLIPIGDKTIIEMIMDKFTQYGVNKFYVSVSHKSRMIKAYFEEMSPKYEICYIEETQPLGTVGALSFLKDKIKDSVMVSNCDIIIENDYCEIVNFHRKYEYDISIVGSFRHFTIPYGICHIENGGNLVDLQEKPEYDYLVNTGMYLLKKDTLKLIPKNKKFDMPDLIRQVKNKGGRVGVFPIDEKSWIDIGQWEEYHKAIKNLGIVL